jgi:hypothetical protein
MLPPLCAGADAAGGAGALDATCDSGACCGRDCEIGARFAGREDEARDELDGALDITGVRRTGAAGST